MRNSRRAADLAFEANKHMSTLSLTTLALAVAADSLEIVQIRTAFALFAFGVPLWISLQGMLLAVIAGASEDNGTSHAAKYAEGHFGVSVVFFLLGLLILFVLPGLFADLDSILTHQGE